MVTKAGMYRATNGEIFKVQQSRQSGHFYAKQLRQIGGDRLATDGRVVNFEFVYAPGAVRSLGDDELMTLDEAKRFGIEYGVCCVCGAFLRDAVSVSLGIGPVCAKRTTWRTTPTRAEEIA